MLRRTSTSPIIACASRGGAEAAPAPHAVPSATAMVVESDATASEVRAPKRARLSTSRA